MLATTAWWRSRAACRSASPRPLVLASAGRRGRDAADAREHREPDPAVVERRARHRSRSRSPSFCSSGRACSWRVGARDRCESRHRPERCPDGARPAARRARSRPTSARRWRAAESGPAAEHPRSRAGDSRRRRRGDGSAAACRCGATCAPSISAFPGASCPRRRSRSQRDSPDYFRAMSPLLKGGSLPTTIAMAATSGDHKRRGGQQVFPGRDPIGQRSSFLEGRASSALSETSSRRAGKDWRRQGFVPLDQVGPSARRSCCDWPGTPATWCPL